MLEFGRYRVLLHFNFSFFDSFVVGLLRLGLRYRLHLSLKCGSVPREAIALLSSYELICLSAVDMKSFQCSRLILIFIARFCVFMPELNIRNLWTNILFFILAPWRRVRLCACMCARSKPKSDETLISVFIEHVQWVQIAIMQRAVCLPESVHCVDEIWDTRRAHNWSFF